MTTTETPAPAGFWRCPSGAAHAIGRESCQCDRDAQIMLRNSARIQAALAALDAVEWRGLTYVALRMPRDVSAERNLRDAGDALDALFEAGLIERSSRPSTLVNGTERVWRLRACGWCGKPQHPAGERCPNREALERHDVGRRAVCGFCGRPGHTADDHQPHENG